jgi:hypothetical protein
VINTRLEVLRDNTVTRIPQCMSLGLALSGRDAMSDLRLQCTEKRKWKTYARNWSPNTRRLYSSRILSAMLVLDSKLELGE